MKCINSIGSARAGQIPLFSRTPQIQAPRTARTTQTQANGTLGFGQTVQTSRAPQAINACIQGEDRQELSSLARKTHKVSKGHLAPKVSIASKVGNVSEGGVRLDLVRRVRAEIAAGFYESPDKIEAVIDGLAKRLSESHLKLTDQDV